MVLALAEAAAAAAAEAEAEARRAKKCAQPRVCVFLEFFGLRCSSSTVLA